MARARGAARINGGARVVLPVTASSSIAMVIEWRESSARRRVWMSYRRGGAWRAGDKTAMAGAARLSRDK